MTWFKVRHELSSVDTLMMEYEYHGLKEAHNKKVDIKWLQNILTGTIRKESVIYKNLIQQQQDKHGSGGGVSFSKHHCLYTL